MRAALTTALLFACNADPAALPLPQSPPIAQCTVGIAAVVGGVGYATIQDAINASTSPAAIEVCPGTWAEHLVLPAGTWELTGLVSSGITPTIDGTANGRVLDASAASDVTLRSLHLTNGQSGWGAGLYMNSGSLNVIGCTFTENTGSNGAGLYTTGTDVEIADSTFDSNSGTDPEGCGGAAAIYASSGEDVSVTIKNSIFATNTAAETGGGLCAMTLFDGVLDLLILESTFKYNDANVGGGLTLWTYGGTLTSRTESSLFYQNEGGATYMFTESGAGACDMEPDFIYTDFIGNHGGNAPAITAYEFCGALDVRAGYGSILNNVAVAPYTSAVEVAVGATLLVADMDMGTGATDNTPMDFYNCAGSYGAGTTGMIRSGIGDWCP